MGLDHKRLYHKISEVSNIKDQVGAVPARNNFSSLDRWASNIEICLDFNSLDLVQWGACSYNLASLRQFA